MIGAEPRGVPHLMQFSQFVKVRHTGILSPFPPFSFPLPNYDRVKCYLLGGM